MSEKGSYYYKNSLVESTINNPNDNEINHSALQLSQNPEYYEIQRGNNYEFIVFDLDGIEPVPGATNQYAVDNAEEVLRLSVTSAPVPHFSQNPIEVKRGNTTVKYAGVPTYSSGSIKMIDYIGAGTLETLMAWQNRSFNIENQRVGLAKDYKKQAILIEYTPTWQPIRQWRMYGCWISELSENDFDYDSNEKHTVTAKIEYDYAKLEEVN